MNKQEDDNYLIKTRLQSIFENMQDAFFQAGLDGRFTYVNPAAGIEKEKLDTTFDRFVQGDMGL